MLPENVVVIGDSYFGVIQTLEALALEGHHGIFSCKGTCPSYLFKDHLCLDLIHDNDTASCYGRIQGASGQSVSFLANAFQSQGRKLFTLSTCFSSELKEIEVAAFVEDETEEDQRVEVSSVERRPEVRNVYSDFMDFNDTANAVVLSSTVQARKYHWTSAYMFWVLSMLFCVNSRKCYQSATGETLTLQEWRDLVMEALAYQSDDCEVGKGRKGRCRSCWYFLRMDVRTRKRCVRCGPICKNCHVQRHSSFAKIFQWRSTGKKTYPVGRKERERRKKSETNVNKLVY